MTGDKREDVELRVVAEDERDFDPWRFENTGYSRDKFYTKSRDKEGGQTTQRYHVSSLVAEEVASLVAERTIPEYRTSQDFVRDAVYHRLHDIAEMRQLGTLQRRITAEMLNIRLQQRLRSFEENALAVAQTEEVLNRATKAGAREALRELLDMGMAEVEFLDDPWRGQVFALLNRFEEEYKRIK